MEFIGTHKGSDASGVSALVGLALAVAVATFAVLSLAGPAHAATFPVTNTSDAQTPSPLPGSLRAAIVDANAAPGRDVITFGEEVTGTITLRDELPVLFDDVEVRGPGADVLSVEGAFGSPFVNLRFRIFEVPQHVTAEISGLTISGGFVLDEGSNLGGGAIRNLGHLTVRASTIQDNVARVGGGIYNRGTLTVTDSTITDNEARREDEDNRNSIGIGGGIANDGIGSVTVQNSTITQNAAVTGAGVWSDSLGDTTIENSTIFHRGGGPAVASPFSFDVVPITLKSTIVGDFSLFGSGTGCDGKIDSRGFNLDNDGSCQLDQPTDKPSTPPLLGPLTANGGPTETMKPSLTSPALDQGHAGSLTSDQRGGIRPLDHPGIANAPGGDGTDIGAVELQASEVGLVTNTDDAGEGSLRRSIIVANTTNGPSVIRFADGVTGTINLQSPLDHLARSVELRGPGADLLTVSRASEGPHRIFTVASGVTAEISGLTISNGSGGDAGGGILNNGNLTVTAATISGNTADFGGGIANNGGGNLTVTASTINGNHAVLDNGGGGIDNVQGSLTVSNSTVSENTSVGENGAGGIWSSSLATTTIRNSTIAANTNSTAAGPANLSAIANPNVPEPPLTLKSTIVAEPQGGGPNCSGAISSDGFNLADDASCPLDKPTDRPSTDPELGPLAASVGPTRTMKPSQSSPVLDQGHAGSLTADQRGEPRPLDLPVIADASGGDGADIGAVESQASEFSPAAATITGGPSGQTTETEPTFTFAAQNARVVECSIDNGAPGFGPCSGAESHKPAAPLAAGNWTFRVRALNAAAEPATATRGFAIVAEEPPSPPSPPPTPPLDGVQIDGNKLKLNRKGVTTLRLLCPAGEAGGCHGSLALKTAEKVRFKGKKRKLTLAGAKFEIGAGETKNVKLKLDEAERKLVAKMKAARKVDAIVKFENQDGEPAKQTKRMQLEPPKRRH